MVIDTSAIVAILRSEPEAATLERTVVANPIYSGSTSGATRPRTGAAG